MLCGASLFVHLSLKVQLGLFVELFTKQFPGNCICSEGINLCILSTTL